MSHHWHILVADHKIQDATEAAFQSINFYLFTYQLLKKPVIYRKQLTNRSKLSFILIIIYTHLVPAHLLSLLTIQQTYKTSIWMLPLKKDSV